MTEVAPAPARRPLPPREQLVRSERTLRAAAVLAILAAVTQWLLWIEREPERPDVFVGPPRSDYVLDDFALRAYGDDGRRRFEVEAPRLSRHPETGTLFITTPDFRLWDAGGHPWTARARQGEVDAGGDVLTLAGDVEVERLAGADVAPLEVETERLVALLEQNRLRSPVAVTVTQPGSILRGTGLEADLGTGRIVLEHQVTARYDPRIAP